MFKMYTEMFFPSLRSSLTHISDQINFNNLTRNTSSPQWDFVWFLSLLGK